jgi:CIC family chloride channel protein
MGLFVPQVLGVGYGYVGDALNGRMALSLMALLVGMKLVGATTSYASGNAGGIFGPSLFIGAMMGGTVGSIAHHLFPAYTATSGAYALVGMGAAFAGIVRAPMTSVLMIFETTRDYTVIVPLMISNLVSYLIASTLQEEPIYTALAWQDGIHLPTAETHQRRQEFSVIRAMRPANNVLPAHLTISEAKIRVTQNHLRTWPVVDERGVIGILSLVTLEDARQNLADSGQISDLLNPHDFPHVHSDETLDLALERMGTAGVDLLPVVSRANINNLEGVITLDDLLAAFRIEKSRDHVVQ